jgi:hypothetical protein
MKAKSGIVGPWSMPVMPPLGFAFETDRQTDRNVADHNAIDRNVLP